MRRAFILDFPPDKQNLIDQVLDRLAAEGVRVLSTSSPSTSDHHFVPHFHYLCPHCDWVAITVREYATCPRCGREPDVSPDGITQVQARIPTFVKNFGQV